MKKISRLRIWIRMTIARREMRRAQKALREEIEHNKQRETSIIERYEKALAVERNNVQCLHKEWADRFLQMHGQAPMFVDKEDVDVPRLEKSGLTSDIRETMDYDTRQLYLDRKDQFWEEGLEANIPESEILQRWKKVEGQVVNDCIGLTRMPTHDE